MAASRSDADADGHPDFGCPMDASHRTIFDCLFLELHAALSSFLRSSSAFRPTQYREMPMPQVTIDHHDHTIRLTSVGDMVQDGMLLERPPRRVRILELEES